MSLLDRHRILAGDLDHPEGVVWGLDGRVYAGGEAGQLYAIDLDGSVETISETGGFTLGLAVDGTNALYACDMGRGAVMRVDLATGANAPFSSGTADDPMRSPNYPAFDAAGTLYVTDSGSWGADDGVIYRIGRDGETIVWTRAVTRFPNGCCLALDGSALLVVESRMPGVVRVPIEADGSAGAPVPYIELRDTVPDGVAFDASGALYVSCYRPDRIYRVEAGVATVLVDDPLGMALCSPTNIAFGGPGLDQLLIANLGGRHVGLLELGVPGAPLRYPG